MRLVCATCGRDYTALRHLPLIGSLCTTVASPESTCPGVIVLVGLTLGADGRLYEDADPTP